MYLRYLYGVQVVILTSHVYSIYCITTAIPLLQKAPELRDMTLEIINFVKNCCQSLIKRLNSD